MRRAVASAALFALLASAAPVCAELAGCDSALPLGCGSRVRDVTPPPAASTDRYGCTSPPHHAQERVYQIDLPADATLHAVLSKTHGRELHLFLLESCDEIAGCILGGESILHAPMLHPGTYYLVVDGLDQADEGTFTLEVNCDLIEIRPLGCGDSVQATLPLTGLFPAFSCGGDAAGGEAWFEIDERQMNDLIVTVDRSDVEARLFRPPMYRSNRCVANGVGMLFYENPAPGRYILAVDGAAGTVGDVVVELDCVAPEPGECSFWEMNEGEGLVTGVGPFTQHGQPEEYLHATPPAPEDIGWAPAPHPTLVQMRRGSTLCGQANCLEALEFTYFRTYVRLPEIVDVFSILVSNVDDGAGFLLNGRWRDDHAFLGGGVAADLLRPPGAEIPGAVNEVMVVQVDDCCSDSFLLDTRCYSEAGERPCVAIAPALPPPQPLCPGDTLPLDAAGASMLNCDGDVLYQWFVDGVPLGPPSTDPTSAAVLHQDATIRLEVSCSDDAACSDSSEFFATVIPPHVPEAVGNALRAVALDKQFQASFTWEAAPGPFGTEHYHVWRAQFPDGPWEMVSGHALRAEAFTDLPVPVGPLRLLFYDVRRAVCEYESAN